MFPFIFQANIRRSLNIFKTILTIQKTAVHIGLSIGLKIGMKSYMVQCEHDLDMVRWGKIYIYIVNKDLI